MECSEMMERRTNVEECSVILPPELLVEILLRLPVKSLARFKCTSKSWLSLISDPSFALSHFDLDLARTDRILLSVHDAREIASVDFNAPLHQDDTTKPLNPPIPLPSQQSSMTEMIGSCRGFIALFQYFPNICIWNPCTSVERRIPSPPIPPMNSPAFTFLHGFGYDPSTDDYLVTLGYCEGCDNEIHVVIFSVRANTWKHFESITLEILNSPRSFSEVGGLFFNGALHWIACSYADDSSVLDIIVAFDLMERVFFEIALPDGFKSATDVCELRVLGGCLSVCSAIRNGFDEEIWVMGEYKVQSSWRSLVHVTCRDVVTPTFLLPICLTVGGDIVGIDGFTELVKFNDKGEVLERRDYNDIAYRKKCYIVMHTHSMLSLSHHSLQVEEINNDN